MHFRIKPFSKNVRSLYEKHGSYHEGDAGLDLFIIDKTTVRPGLSGMIKLQIACENIDNKPYFLLPRSSISKTSLRLSNSVGLIDAGYRGEIMAVVDNIKAEEYTVEPGQRLFQLVPIDGSPISFELVDELSETTRGKGGFGSTGK